VNNDTEDFLTWEDSFAIAQALILRHPNVDLIDVSLSMIHQWTITLPGFHDDPALSNDGILSAIYQEWYEEVNPV
jgi:FeS assembly protein IscX